MKLKVITYNLLSAKLAPPSHFPTCRPEYLDADARFKKILEKLEKHVKQEAVVCLQEVSLQWTGPLVRFFHAHHYHFIQTNYGRMSNGYMGVGIAYPQVFQTVDTLITEVYDSKPKEENSTPSLWSQIDGFAGLGWLRRFLPLGDIKEDPWTLAARQNRLVVVSLRDPQTQNTFTIGTYHMPCLFGSSERRAAVVIHTSHTLKLIQDFSKDYPRIFCGDFNFAPESAAYRLITEGVLEDDIPPGPLPPTHAMGSAYALAGGEPKFTNYAQVDDMPIFAETLDYIFVSPEWTVTRTEELPDPIMQEMLGPNPTEDEPSDHYLIGAWLELKA